MTNDMGPALRQTNDKPPKRKDRFPDGECGRIAEMMTGWFGMPDAAQQHVDSAIEHLRDAERIIQESR